MEARFFRALYRARTYPLLVIPKRQAVDQTIIWRWLRGLRLTPRAARVPERAVQKQPSRRQSSRAQIQAELDRRPDSERLARPHPKRALPSVQAGPVAGRGAVVTPSTLASRHTVATMRGESGRKRLPSRRGPPRPRTYPVLIIPVQLGASLCLDLALVDMVYLNCARARRCVGWSHHERSGAPATTLLRPQPLKRLAEAGS